MSGEGEGGAAEPLEGAATGHRRRTPEGDDGDRRGGGERAALAALTRSLPKSSVGGAEGQGICVTWRTDNKLVDYLNDKFIPIWGACILPHCKKTLYGLYYGV